HPPQQPRRHGRLAAAVPRRRIRRDAEPDRRGDLYDRRPGRYAAQLRAGQRDHGPRETGDRPGADVPGRRPHRHAAGSAVLSARRDSAIRAATAARTKMNDPFDTPRIVNESQSRYAAEWGLASLLMGGILAIMSLLMLLV